MERYENGTSWFRRCKILEEVISITFVKEWNNNNELDQVRQRFVVFCERVVRLQEAVKDEQLVGADVGRISGRRRVCGRAGRWVARGPRTAIRKLSAVGIECRVGRHSLPHAHNFLDKTHEKTFLIANIMNNKICIYIIRTSCTVKEVFNYV